MPKGSSFETAWRTSRAEVINAIRSQRIVSRSQLARQVSVSRATVSSIVSELLQVGILEEQGKGVSTGGRPPIKLRYCPESRFAVGVVLFDNEVQVALTDMEGVELNYLQVPFAHNTPEAMLEAMAEAVRRILERVPKDQVLGVGVGTPGIVDFETGIIEISVGKGWLEGGIRVREFLEDALGLPIYVANRSRVAALGESRVGIGQDVSNLIYVFLGQGIAAGIVIDGCLYRGTSCTSGEIGHVSIEPQGPLCTCGNRGCLEVYAAEAAIVAHARSAAREEMNSLMKEVVEGRLERLTIEDVVQAAQQGDAAALHVLADAGARVGFAISILIDLFNPDMVVVGGPIGSRAGDLLLKSVTEEVRRRTLSLALEGTRIVIGELGTKAVAIGAAVLALNHASVDRILGV